MATTGNRISRRALAALACVCGAGCSPTGRSPWRDAIEQNRVVRLEPRAKAPSGEMSAPNATNPAVQRTEKKAANAATQPKADWLQPPSVAPQADGNDRAPPIVITPDHEAAAAEKSKQANTKPAYAVPPPPILPKRDAQK